jgi:hypothetical protein
MKLPKVHSFKVHTMLTDPKFIKRMEGSVSVIKKYDIPYVAGYSKDGKRVYIDRHVEPKMNGIDIAKYIVLHEHVEKSLMDLFNLKYQQAHHIALSIEHASVIEDGVDWDAYSKHIDKYTKKLSHEDLTHSPPDLDLSPYKDEKELPIFLRKHNKHELSKSSNNS